MTVGIAYGYPVEEALYGVCHHAIFMKVRAVLLYAIWATAYYYS